VKYDTAIAHTRFGILDRNNKLDPECSRYHRLAQNLPTTAQLLCTGNNQTEPDYKKHQTPMNVEPIWYEDEYVYTLYIN